MNRPKPFPLILSLCLLAALGVSSLLMKRPPTAPDGTPLAGVPTRTPAEHAAPATRPLLAGPDGAAAPIAVIEAPAVAVAPQLPTYIVRSRETQLDISALPTRTTAPGRQDRLEIFPDVAATVRWEKMADHGSHNWAWYGSLLEDRLSGVTLTRVADYTIIDIQSPKFGHYEIHGQDGKPAALRQLDPDQINRGCQTVLTAGYGDNPAAPVDEQPAAGPVTAGFSESTIDVLMVYTTKAMDLAGGRSAIVAKAQAAVNGENSNFNRSEIVHTMRLVQTRETSHTASDNLPNELGWVAGNSTVASQRSETSADLVAFISDKDSAGVRGIAQLPGPFTANFYDTLSGVWPHEAGHNFGCQHNSAGVYSYASGHYWLDDGGNGTTYGSIMSYIGTRVPYFSNPSVSHWSGTTGTSTRNNARCVNERGGTVAAYKSGSKVIVEPSCVVTASTIKPNIGVDFTVSIKSVNTGPSTMGACQIGVTLPSKVTLVSHNGGTAFNSSTKVWSVPSLADNGSATLVLTLRPTADASGISQTASAAVNTVGSGTIDFNIYNNSGSTSWVAVPVPTSNLILHYALDETSGKTAADGSSNEGTQHATTTYASPLWQPTGGMIGGALRFTPTAQADVAQAFSYSSGVPIIANYPLTMALWLRATPGTWYQVCSMLGDQSTGGSYFELSMNNSRANAMARNTSNSGVSATSPSTLKVADDAWHHLAAVFTSATSRTLYVDGVAVATNTTSVPFVPNNKRFSLGALMRDVPTQSFPGYLDDVGLWNTALTKEHLAIIHALGRYSRVDLDDAAIATLVDAGLTPGSSAIAGGYRWVATTGLSGAVGSASLLDGQPYLVLNASGGGLVGISTQPPANHWFDANGTAADFGVANNGTYDWKGGNLWNPSNTGVAPVGPWVSGNDANFVGAGLGTSYTVRLGATGTNHVMLRNLLLNSDGAEPITPHGSGDAVIGASGDTGELRPTADSAIGTAGGILTVNNPFNLGAGQSLNCGGGTVRLNGFVAGTGTAGVTLSARGFFSGELAAGALTLANPGNTYPGATAVAAGYTLEVTKLANGGSPSSIGASSNAATNLILGGGTLRYIGATAATDRSFTLAPDTVSMIDVSAVDAVLTFSGSSTATSGGLIKLGAGTLALAGTNTFTGDTIVNGGTLAVTGASIADTNTLVISGGKVNATGTETVASLFFGEVQQAAGTWGASGSGATHLDDLRFTGSGRISVTTGPFSRWIGGFGLNLADEAPTADPDADGITNLLEYVLGGNPGVNDATAIAATGTQVGSNYIFTFNRNDLSETDTTLTVEYGSDLAVWGSYSVGAAPGAAPVVIQEDAPDATLDSVTVTIPTGGAPKFFARLKVSN